MSNPTDHERLRAQRTAELDQSWAGLVDAFLRLSPEHRDGLVTAIGRVALRPAAPGSCPWRELVDNYCKMLVATAMNEVVQRSHERLEVQDAS